MNQNAPRPSPSLWILGLFLVFAAYCNLNDPDAFFWTPFYAMGGVLCWITVCCWQTSNTKPQQSTAAQYFYKTYLILSLAVAAFSFSLLRSEAARVSGKSGWWLSVLELEPVREGGGSLILALALYLCVSFQQQQQGNNISSSSTTSSWIVTFIAGTVAAVGIYLGVILPQYYTRLGVAIPEHCGGMGEEGGTADANPLLQSEL